MITATSNTTPLTYFIPAAASATTYIPIGTYTFTNPIYIGSLPDCWPQEYNPYTYKYIDNYPPEPQNDDCDDCGAMGNEICKEGCPNK